MIDITAPAEPFQEVEPGTEALLEAWLVGVADPVSAGQPVADVVLVKASFQIVAPGDGVIAEIVVPAGDTFAAGAVLARVEEHSPAQGPATATDR